MKVLLVVENLLSLFNFKITTLRSHLEPSDPWGSLWVRQHLPRTASDCSSDAESPWSILLYTFMGMITICYTQRRSHLRCGNCGQLQTETFGNTEQHRQQQQNLTASKHLSYWKNKRVSSVQFPSLQLDCPAFPLVNNSQAEPSADRHGSMNVLVCAWGGQWVTLEMIVWSLTMEIVCSCVSCAFKHFLLSLSLWWTRWGGWGSFSMFSWIEMEEVWTNACQLKRVENRW